MKRGIGLLSMLVRENLRAGDLVRTPENRPAMDTENQATAWHAQGAADGPILPVYHLNALACSRLAPAGGTVVDLGCGSGRFAAYLARCRPDLQIVGLDLSAPMVEIGNAALRDEGLHDRVQLRVGDMTAFSRTLPSATSLIGSLFAVHHLPGLREVRQCLEEIRAASEGTGCSFWIFDLVRPRHASTATDYPNVFTPGSQQVFQLDSTDSLHAAYSHAELAGEVDSVFPQATVARTRSRILPLYQAFWLDGARRHASAKPLESHLPSHPPDLPRVARRQYQALRAILPGLPR